MNKGKNFNSGHPTVEALSASIVSLLLKEGKVVIPELGYLELKVFPDKQTVLFKATENTALFLASEGSIQSQIYDNVSVPLKEGKVVTLPEIGIFRPMKNTDGSYRVSYTISSALRQLLNGAKEGASDEVRVDTPVVVVDPIALPAINEQNPEEKKEEKEKAEKEEVKKTEIEKKETGESKIEYKATESKEPETEQKKAMAIAPPAPKREVKAVERKTPSYVRNTSKVGDLVVPQEGKEKNVTKTRGVIAIIAALIALIFCIWYFLPGGKNRNDHAFVTGNSKTELTQVVDHSNESAKSYGSIDLPSLAEQKYGNRIFWVYIYEANRDKISSPVNIPAGINLRIPNLWEDYKVDVMDSMEIKRAGALSKVMLQRKLQL